jgi:D-glutamate cyclase-like protein
VLDPIDHLLALDLGARGIASFFVPRAAGVAAHALVRARRVLIATGFTVAADTPETDGPPGATVLGRALRRLGARVVYVTDPHNEPIVEAALKTLDEPVDILLYPEGDGAAPGVLARERPTHLVAVERPGRAVSGEYMNLRGQVITPWNRRIDELFLRARGESRARGATRRHAKPASVAPVTVGVGDGGNEIGMGNVRRRLLRAGGLLARTSSIVGVDHLVVAATSNWGAYGVVAALARLTGEDLLHAPDAERRLIEACVQAGASDGITRRREATVDGLGTDTHAAVVALLTLAARARPRP